MGLQEAERAGQFKADRQNDMLSASIGAPDHPSRLRAHSSGYAKVKDVYGKGSRRRTRQSETIREQNQKIDQLQAELHSQRDLLSKVLSILPPEFKQQLGDSPGTVPSHIPTQVSSTMYLHNRRRHMWETR